MKATLGIPDALSQLSVLQQAIRSRRIKWTHAHIHAPKRKDSPHSISPEISTRSRVNALEWMQRNQMPQKARPTHTQQGREVLPQHMRDAELIVLVRLVEKCQIPLEPFFAFPPLNLRLHCRKIRGELEVFAIAEPDIVVGSALYDIHTFV